MRLSTDPIIALDFPTWADCEKFLAQFNEQPLFVKVGMELFLQNGYPILDKLSQAGHSIFLDLKLHDIPNTVGQAMKGLAQFNIALINVHASGGQKMMMAAKEGLIAGTPAGLTVPKLIAVTQLTSTSESQMQQEQGIMTSLQQSVLNYAELAQQAGLDGVVCSVQEANAVRDRCGADFLKVTPGIRLAEDSKDDQVRIATPDYARAQGSTQIVVGRSITKALDPVEKYQLVKSLWEKK